MLLTLLLSMLRRPRRFCTDLCLPRPMCPRRVYPSVPRRRKITSLVLREFASCWIALRGVPTGNAPPPRNLPSRYESFRVSCDYVVCIYSFPHALERFLLCGRTEQACSMTVYTRLMLHTPDTYLLATTESLFSTSPPPPSPH